MSTDMNKNTLVLQNQIYREIVKIYFIRNLDITFYSAMSCSET